MQGLACTVRYSEAAGSARDSSREVAALLTCDHPSSARGVPVVAVDGKAVGVEELAAAVVLDEPPGDGEAVALVRSARMHGYRVESPGGGRGPL